MSGKVEVHRLCLRTRAIATIRRAVVLQGSGVLRVATGGDRALRLAVADQGDEGEGFDA